AGSGTRVALLTLGQVSQGRRCPWEEPPAASLLTSRGTESTVSRSWSDGVFRTDRPGWAAQGECSSPEERVYPLFPSPHVGTVARLGSRRRRRGPPAAPACRSPGYRCGWPCPSAGTVAGSLPA